VLTVLFGSRAGGVAVAPRVRTAVMFVCAGTGGFVALSAISGAAPANAVRPGSALLVVAGAVALTALGLTVRGRARCLALAASSAVLFGSGSAVIRTASVSLFGSGVSAAGLGLAVLAAGLMVSGGWLQHQAYACGPPAVVIGAATVIDPLTAVIVGIGVYGEAAWTGPVQAAAQLGLAAIAMAAVLVLARALPDPRPRVERPEELVPV
jgi:hypothetical protein